MVAPEVPRGRPVRQSVFDDQADGQRQHPVGIVALRQGQVVHVGVEVAVALGAAMLGVRDMNIAGPPRSRISQIMERPLGGPHTIGPPPTLRAGPPTVIAAAPDRLGLWQILNTRNAFRAVGNVLARLPHGDTLQRPLGLWNHRLPAVQSQEKTL